MIFKCPHVAASSWPSAQRQSLLWRRHDQGAGPMHFQGFLMNEFTGVHGHGIPPMSELTDFLIYTDVKSHSHPPAWSYSQAACSSYADASTVLE